MSKTLRKLGAIFTSSVVLSSMLVGCGSDSATSANKWRRNINLCNMG